MKVFIFSHIADCDGITPVILSKLSFEHVDYKLLNNPIDKEFLDFVNNYDFSEYDAIYMIDLCINEETLQQLDNSFINKFRIFDHHIARNEMNKYDFIQVIEERNNIKESGTSLYYEYLRQFFDNELLRKNVTKEIVEIVRLADTFSWKENEERNFALTDFLAIMGIEEYINYFYNFILNNDEFYLEEKYKFLFEVENKRKFNYIEEKEKQLIKAYIKPYNVGIIFAENYRSILGNELANRNKDLDFIIIINLSRSISYRGIKESINLSDFASIYGGKGHKFASGSPLPDNIKELIIKTIFKEVEINEK